MRPLGPGYDIDYLFRQVQGTYTLATELGRQKRSTVERIMVLPPYVWCYSRTLSV